MAQAEKYVPLPVPQFTEAELSAYLAREFESVSRLQDQQTVTTAALREQIFLMDTF